MQITHKKTNRENILHAIVISAMSACSLCFFFIAGMVNNTFGRINPSQLFFHLAMPVKQADVNGAVKQIIGIFCCSLGIAIIIYFVLWSIFKWIDRCRFVKKSHLQVFLYIFAGVCLMAAGDYFNEYIPFKSGIDFYCFESKMIENEFFQPLPGELRFLQKRNCIVIVMESVEETFSKPDVVGGNMIPELMRIKEKNLSFDRRVQCNGTGWTIAALVNIFFGIPQLPLHGLYFANAGNNRRYKLPSIFDYFLQGGYSCTYMQGGYMEFAGKEYLFEDHPGVKIVAFDELSGEDDYISNRAPFEWGVDDGVLFKKIKEECLRLSEQNQPFFLVALTLDTHGPNGYLPPEHLQKEKDFFAEVLRVADYRISNLINWIKSQSFAENTTIIIVSDHLAMSNSFMSKLRKFSDDVLCEKRKTYNCFINSAVHPKKKDGRLFAAFDLMPTILHAAGAQWGSNRLHLGVSLFGDTPTILEKYGIEYYEKESLKRSDKYLKMFDVSP